MPQPSQSAFQGIYALHGFPIAPHYRYTFEKVNHRLCGRFLSLGTNEFQQKISKDNNVPQSLIYVRDIVKKRAKDPDLSRIKI